MDKQHNLTDGEALYDALVSVEGDVWRADALRAPVETWRSVWPAWLAWLNAQGLTPSGWAPSIPQADDPASADSILDPYVPGATAGVEWIIAADGEVLLVTSPASAALADAARAAGFRTATVGADARGDLAVLVDGVMYATAAPADDDSDDDSDDSDDDADDGVGMPANGAFAFYRVRGVIDADVAALETIANAHGLASEDVVPAYAGDRTALARAVTRTRSGLARVGFMIRDLKLVQGRCTYGIVRETKLADATKLHHDHEASLLWDAEVDPAVIVGDHPVARRVAEAYASLRGKIVADDWTATISKWMAAHDCVRMRDDGRVYFVPPQRIEEARQLKGYLDAVGIDLVLCEVKTEQRQIVRDVTQGTLADEIARLTAEVEDFNGTQKPSTYERRLDEYQALRERAGLYRDALGIGVEQVEDALDALEEKVGEMFALRTQTVVHRAEKVVAPLVKPAALVFGDVRFVANGTPGSFAAEAMGAASMAADMLALSFGLGAPVGPGTLRASRTGSQVVLTLTGATPAECAPALRAFGIEVEG